MLFSCSPPHHTTPQQLEKVRNPPEQRRREISKSLQFLEHTEICFLSCLGLWICLSDWSRQPMCKKPVLHCTENKCAWDQLLATLISFAAVYRAFKTYIRFSWTLRVVCVNCMYELKLYNVKWPECEWLNIIPWFYSHIKSIYPSFSNTKTCKEKMHYTYVLALLY